MELVLRKKFPAFLRTNLAYLPAVLLLFSYLAVLVRTAWMSDDAFVTLRTVDNFVNGYGLTWNPGERVQAYTHPLWMFFLSGLYAVTREPFYTVIVASIVLSAGAIIVLLMSRRYPPLTLCLPLALFVLSRSFVEYSTSGLEQPMTFVLLALFIRWIYCDDRTKSHTILAAAATAAAGLNRLDTLLIFLPPLAAAVWKHRSLRLLAWIATALSPLILWELFSFFYYGFGVPNTAFAKLGHGLPESMIIDQGIAYFVNSLRADPITLAAIATALLTPLIPHLRRYLPLALGIALYAAYIVKIGGDFMSGRFFAVPLFVAAYLLLQSVQSASFKFLFAATTVSIIIGFCAPYPPLSSGANFGVGRKTWGDLIDKDGIADERAFWFNCAGLISDGRKDGDTSCGRKDFVRGVKKKKKRFIESGGVGFLGYYAGPDIYIFDGLGLADPLIARLSCVSSLGWRPGHYPKPVPGGYLKTLESGANTIEDPKIKQYYTALHTIVSGDLWSENRIREIWKMNTGAYEHLIERKVLVPPPKTIPPQPFMTKPDPRFPVNKHCFEQGMPYYRIPKMFSNGRTITAGALEFAANEDAEYRIDWMKGNDEIVESRTIPPLSDEGTITRQCIEFSPSSLKRGFDRIRFEPMVGTFGCLSYFRLAPSCDP